MIANDRLINQRNCTISSGSSRNDCDKRQLVDEKLKEEDPNADHFSKTSVTNKRQRTLTVEPVSSWMDVEFSNISSLFGQFELHNLNGPKSTDLREKILFRFPFHGEHTVIEEASAGTCLKCIGGPLGASHTKATTTGHENHGASTTETIATEMLARNRICITGNEVYRLSKKIECGYLNDELVHFGIKWLTRKSIGREERDKDFMSLTSYVYTLLNSSTRSDRFEAAYKATQTGCLFSHKIISVPIVDGNHWTVCFIVNPRHVGNHFSKSNDFPCMLYFNSLTDKLPALSEKHAANIREWLNHCWMREKKSTTQRINR